ncbi:MAG: universal stress protein [Pseudomonadota bacterium]
MTYKSLLVHLHLGHSNIAVLNVARSLAEHYKAEVIGIMVGQQTQMIYGKGYAALDFFDREDEHLENRISEAEGLFKDAFEGFSRKIEWRSTITREPIANYIAAQARCADLIITGVSPSDFYEGPTGVTAGEIVMQAGRPVLAVPVDTEKLILDTILVGWKDTREARRAVADALPLLRLARKVNVIEMAEEADVLKAENRLHDVTNWLRCHDIAADYSVSPSVKDDATQFISIAKQHNTNLVIAGAYGHSRLREWALGGVTNELLQRAQFCCLLSH